MREILAQQPRIPGVHQIDAGADGAEIGVDHAGPAARRRSRPARPPARRRARAASACGCPAPMAPAATPPAGPAPPWRSTCGHAGLELDIERAAARLAQHLDLGVRRDRRHHPPNRVISAGTIGVLAQAGDPERSGVAAVAADHRPALRGDRHARRPVPAIRDARRQHAAAGVAEAGLEQFAQPAAEAVIGGVAVADLQDHHRSVRCPRATAGAIERQQRRGRARVSRRSRRRTSAGGDGGTGGDATAPTAPARRRRRHDASIRIWLLLRIRDVSLAQAIS